MGNFAHKFNTRDIKLKLASEERKTKMFIQTLFDSLSVLSRIQFFLNAPAPNIYTYLCVYRGAIKCVLLQRIASFFPHSLRNLV